MAASGEGQRTGAERGLARPGHPRRAAAAGTLLRPPRLVGRDVERNAIDRAWSEGRAVLLRGEAGLGKSRLLAELAQRQGC